MTTATTATHQERIWQWQQSAWHAVDQAPPCIIADSWRVDNGQVLAWNAHRLRFNRACCWYLPAPLQHLPNLIFELVSERIPTKGHYFPRLEMSFHEGLPRFFLRIRPLPPPRTTITLTTYAPDPRQMPQLKGPDLAVLEQCRTQIGAYGADEALLLDERQGVLEGLYSTIVWWEQNTLCYPPPHPRRLPGTTLPRLLQLAQHLDIQTRCYTPHIRSLYTVPIWAINSLHGIMEATILLPGHTIPRHPDLERWRNLLKQQTQPKLGLSVLP